MVAALLLPATAGGFSSPPKLNDIASWLSQKPVKVRCLTKKESENDTTIAVWGAAAYVNIITDKSGVAHPAAFTVISYPICNALTDALKGKSYYHSIDDTAWAILVITHESGHMRGANFPYWRSEGDVNCWALRRFKAVAQLSFGFSPEQADILLRQAIKIYNHQPDAYNFSGCTKGLR